MTRLVDAKAFGGGGEPCRLLCLLFVVQHLHQHQQRIIARQLLYTNAPPTPFTLLKSLLTGKLTVNGRCCLFRRPTTPTRLHAYLHLRCIYFLGAFPCRHRSTPELNCRASSSAPCPQPRRSALPDRFRACHERRSFELTSLQRRSSSAGLSGRFQEQSPPSTTTLLPAASSRN